MDSQAHRGFPGKFESSNVSRDNVSREIGRNLIFMCCPLNVREKDPRLPIAWKCRASDVREQYSDEVTPNLPTKSLGFEGFDSSRLLLSGVGIIISKEFDRESPGKFDPRTLNGETLNRWTGDHTQSTFCT